MKNSIFSARLFMLASMIVVLMGMFLLGNAFFWGHDSITGNILVDISSTDMLTVGSLSLFYVCLTAAIFWATPTRSQVAQ